MCKETFPFSNTPSAGRVSWFVVREVSTKLISNRLKKGPRANILIGPDGGYHIGLEGVAVALLAHFSPYAKHVLVEECGTTLCVPDGSKEPLRWIYKYMQAGEADPEGEMTFEQLSVDCLISLWTHSAALYYQPLMDRVVGRLKGHYLDALPTITEIKLFAEFVPPLYDHAASIVAYELVNPWTCDYSAYTDYAMRDVDFGDKLEKTIQKLIKHRVKVGKKYYKGATNRHVLWSKQYYVNFNNGQVSSFARDKNKPKVNLPMVADGKSKKDSATGIQKKKNNRRAGRRLRKAAQGLPDDSNGKVTSDGKDAQSKKKQAKANTVSCWNCNSHGHRSRDCTVSSEGMYQSKKAKHTSRGGADTGAGPSAKRPARGRRAKRESLVHPIEVNGNGEGLRTCDREVRPGETTRTGLIV